MSEPLHELALVKAPAPRNFLVTYAAAAPLPAYYPPTDPLAVPPPARLDRAGWTLLAVGAVSAGLLLWLLCRWAQVVRMVTRATRSGGLSRPIGDARRLAGLRGPVRVRIADDRMSPAVCGLFRPVILLPRTLAEHLSAEQLRAVLLHEAIHIRRGDIWVNCAQALLQVAYWWHPLVWLANARIRRVREEAVDDAVMLALAAEAEIYAPTLLEVARLALRRPLLSLGLVGILESRSALLQRIERLLAFRAPRQAGLTFASLCGMCVFSAVALHMGKGPARVEKDMAADASPPLRGMTAPATVPHTNPRAAVCLSVGILTNGPAAFIGPGQEIMDKLGKIHLRNVSYDGVPLNEALQQLSGQCKLLDPEHKGINFLISNNPDRFGQPAAAPTVVDIPGMAAGNGVPNLDPYTELPITPAASSGVERSEALDLGSSLIKIPTLTDVSLAEVLDAIVLVADRPIKYSIQDDGVVFSAKAADSPQLFMRTFRVDPAALRMAMENLRAQSGQVAKALEAHSSVGAMVRDFFQHLGVDGESPPGKSVFFNERLGNLFVKATENDLDTIERALQVLNQVPPQVHIKARFVEVSQDDSELGFDWYLSQFSASGTAESTSAPAISILTNPNFQVIWHALQSRTGVEKLGEPEIITISGRQTQMKVTPLHNYIGDFPPYHNGDPIHDGHGGPAAWP